MLKSPLRYPGGKSKAIKQIIEYLPDNFSEFREPFVGGGSVFIYLKQIYPNLKIWINDLNPELFLFWKIAQSDIFLLVQEIRRIKNQYTDGKLLFTELTTVDVKSLSDLERAVRFFILNRITFSGTIESGGFSQESFHKRFTHSSIDRLEKLESILTADIKITNLDYSCLLNEKGENVFLFLDPPYFSATKSRLYGKDGDLHTSFEHQRFAESLKQCHHPWLITYDNSPQIRDNFKCDNIYIFEWELQYGMNNYKQNSAAKGNELFITNYQVVKHLSNEMQSQNDMNQFIQLSLDI
ncbi:DNA adenine methylase [Nostoc sp. FACHB-87]|uniref:DNA adenine methylase n=1 Tax=Nostocaceae TaxID=1162 RepID=UPI001685F3F2|nr:MULTISPECIES: DNA adenine methylase [Nostocaceae]MBD2453742.1 DNA adenine methylase [Nostoc sp. FACHB-87]MBD2475302.1 DNA adenine methylase [Anabaena sp. FACHB-83]